MKQDLIKGGFNKKTISVYTPCRKKERENTS